jgi:hypothetical protein
MSITMKGIEYEYAEHSNVENSSYHCERHAPFVDARRAVVRSRGAPVCCCGAPISGRGAPVTSAGAIVPHLIDRHTRCSYCRVIKPRIMDAVKVRRERLRRYQQIRRSDGARKKQREGLNV